MTQTKNSKIFDAKLRYQRWCNFYKSDTHYETFCYYKERYSQIWTNQCFTPVKFANEDKTVGTGRGSVTVETSMGERTISDVFIVPNITENLLSVGHIVKTGYPQQKGSRIQQDHWSFCEWNLYFTKLWERILTREGSSFRIHTPNSHTAAYDGISKRTKISTFNKRKFNHYGGIRIKRKRSINLQNKSMERSLWSLRVSKKIADVMTNECMSTNIPQRQKKATTRFL